MWAYWPTLAIMAAKWSADPMYSHGYLVPVFSAALLWMRRDLLKRDQIRPNAWGLGLLLLGIIMRLAGAGYYFDWLDAVSLLPCLAGLCLALGGATVLHWAWPSIAFLIFMVPLPFQAEVALREPLRQIGTVTSVYVMQTLGLPVLAEGHQIVLDDIHIGVAEACSGLRMLVTFFALTTAVAILSERPLWERIALLLSALPIAIAANVVRITATASLHLTGYSDLADLVFHDLAGWLMMPLALVLMWLEMWILAHLFIEEEDRMIDVGLETS